MTHNVSPHHATASATLSMNLRAVERTQIFIPLSFTSALPNESVPWCGVLAAVALKIVEINLTPCFRNQLADLPEQQLTPSYWWYRPARTHEM